MHQEMQYLSLIKKIQKGYWENTRNGKVKIISQNMRYSLTNNKIPILTTKKWL